MKQKMHQKKPFPLAVGERRGRGREPKHLAAAAQAEITWESHKWKVLPKNSRCADHSFLLQTATASQ